MNCQLYEKGKRVDVAKYLPFTVDVDRTFAVKVISDDENPGNNFDQENEEKEEDVGN